MLAIVSHDAGGAEVLSSYAHRNKPDCLFVLEGPARQIFARKLGSITPTGLREALSQADNVLCGTSWQSDLEFEAIQLARSGGRHCVAFLDHWVNYAERFARNGVIALPDEIWAGDQCGERIARRIFPGLPVHLVENPYFQDIRDELNAIVVRRKRNPDRLAVLYICEPIREHAFIQYGDERHWGYTEEDALRYFLSRLTALGKPLERIVIRPHPAEHSAKYDWAQREFDAPIVMGGAKPLIEEIVESDVVVGCESMAMFVGVLAGKRVVSCIPPGGKACSLPRAAIQHLQNLP